MAKKEPSGPHPVRVHVAASTVEAGLVIAFLEEKGIVARSEDPATRQALGGVYRRIEGREGFGVLVSSDDEARAIAALAEYRERPALGEGERVEEEE
jgi:hypothetical protein